MDLAPPAAPTGLTVTEITGIDEIQRAAEFLIELDDPEMLGNSRDYSTFVDASIYRWSFKRITLVSRNEINGAALAKPDDCLKAAVAGFQATPQNKSKVATSVPPIGKEVLLNCLTLRDVRELAQFELPKIPDTTKYGVRGGKEVDVTPGALPRNLYMASLVGSVLVLFVLVYFNAFAREAVSSPSFPSEGTIFAAFSKSTWTLSTFALALWVPPAASLSVAVASGRYTIIAISVVTICVIVSVHLTLRRKSYFKPLSPRGLLRWN